MGLIERRLSKIETKLDAIVTGFSKNKSPRQIAQEISEANKDPEHLGKLSLESAEQTIKAAEQSLDKDSVKNLTNKEKSENYEKLDEFDDKIMEDLNEADYQKIHKRIDILMDRLA